MLSLPKTLLPLLLSASLASGQAADAGTIVQILNGLGLTNLTSVATRVANTTAGRAIFGLLLSGAPVTVFAPNNQAFNGVPANITSNTTLLSEIISYHVLPGTINASNFRDNGNTVARTYLNATDKVRLGPPGNQSQAIAGRLEGGKVRILNQNTQVFVQNTSVQGNLTLHVVNAVIDLPGTIEAATRTWNTTLFRTVAESAGLLSALNSAPGITVFIPTDAALQAVAGTTAELNSTIITNVLLNHVINGTVLYSPLLGNNSFTSAAGNNVGFATNTSGIYVSNNSTAKVSQGDIIVQNGVVHLIDSVLLNAGRNEQAANSAYESNTAAQPTATGPLGSPQPGGNSGGGTGAAVAERVSMAMLVIGGFVGAVALL